MANGTSGVVAERGGVDNGIAGTATAQDVVVAAAIDGSSGFVEQTAVTTTYGTFSITASGRWTYRLDDGNGTVQALNVGDRLHDRISIRTLGGTRETIDVTIEGANDWAIITGAATGVVVEKGGIAKGTPGVATATGDLDATDLDNAATFQAQTNVATRCGRFTIDGTGAWTYTPDDSNADVQALDQSGRLHDLVTVRTSDGTKQVIEVAINDTLDRGFDLTYLRPSQGFIIQGDSGSESAGFGVSSAGGVKDDGFADVIVGAPSSGLPADVVKS